LTQKCSLAYVVVQRGDIQQYGFTQASRYPARYRETRLEVRVKETSTIFHDLQGMGIHGVGVEQVVLHLAHDATEFRQVNTQNAVACHAPELSRHFVGRIHDSEESIPVTLIGTKSVVDQVAVIADLADSGRRDTLGFIQVGAQQEYFQQRRGFRVEQLVTAGLDIAIAQLEPVIDDEDVVGGVRPQNGLVKILYQ